MYSCPNCAGALRFSIKSQDLFCDHCDSHFSPYDMEKAQDAEFHESGMFETQVFTCPGCGGEITSTDSQVAGFCSYCGSPTILSKRIEKEHAPASIIPFSVTKEDCISLYKKHLRGGFFAPSGMLSSGHLDQFRGIYMPYWNFTLGQNNTITLRSNESFHVGDYVKHKSFAIRTRVIAEFSGYTYDASSTFHDSISARIAPFDVRKAKKFTPSYLLGFYANKADVPSYYYSEQAEAEAKAELYDFIYKNERFSDVRGVLDQTSIGPQLHPVVTEATPVMFPVWFLAYRYKNRIAYTTVNGQTGKISADLPISIGKYLLFAAIISLLIFPLMILLFTSGPVSLLKTALITSLITMFLYHFELKAIKTSMMYQDDVGYLYRYGHSMGQGSEEHIDQAIRNQIRKQSELKLDQVVEKEKSRFKTYLEDNRETSVVFWTLLIVFLYMGLESGYLIYLIPDSLLGFPKAIIDSFGYVIGKLNEQYDLKAIAFYTILAIGVSIMIPMMIRQIGIQRSVNREVKHIPGVLFSAGAFVIALITLFFFPDRLLPVILATACCLASEFLALVQLLTFCNYLATRKMPQYYMYESERENDD